MLTEAQYKELLRYRGDGVQLQGEKDEIMELFLEKKYIIGYHPALPDGKISETSIYVIVNLGEQALEEFEEHARQMSEERAQKKSDRRFQILNSLLSAVAGSLLTLLVEHFLELMDFLGKFFQ